MKSDENWSIESGEEDIENYTILYIYIAQREVQVTHRGQNFDYSKFYSFNHT